MEQSESNFNVLGSAGKIFGILSFRRMSKGSIELSRLRRNFLTGLTGFFYILYILNILSIPGPDLIFKAWVYIYGYRNLYKA